MLLEKLKQHGGKIMFFLLNIAIVFSGVLFVNQKNIKKTNAVIAQADAESYKSAVDYALSAQQQIMADKATKMNSISSNPDTVQREQGVPVTRTIPAVTKTVTALQSTTGSSKTTTAKTTTKKS